MEDDNEEFAHLAQDETSLTFIGGHENNDDPYDDDDQDDENEPPETVSAVQLQEELRRVARGEEVCTSSHFDPTYADTSYRR